MTRRSRELGAEVDLKIHGLRWGLALRPWWARAEALEQGDDGLGSGFCRIPDHGRMLSRH